MMSVTLMSKGVKEEANKRVELALSFGYQAELKTTAKLL